MNKPISRIDTRFGFIAHRDGADQGVFGTDRAGAKSASMRNLAFTSLIEMNHT